MVEAVNIFVIQHMHSLARSGQILVNFLEEEISGVIIPIARHFHDCLEDA